MFFVRAYPFAFSFFASARKTIASVAAITAINAWCVAPQKTPTNDASEIVADIAAKMLFDFILYDLVNG